MNNLSRPSAAREAEWWTRSRRVSVVVDTPGWFDPFASQIVELARERGHQAELFRDPNMVLRGEVAFYLSCLKITPDHVLALNHQNLVVHASALPHGRGFSPIVWQVLEGRNVIPISMILAASEVDSGDIVMQDRLELEGHELNDEIRGRLGVRIVDMCGRYLDLPAPPEGKPQHGEASWYRRRRPDDSRLLPDKTLAEQFDLLRTVDNDRYPAFFEYRGHKYVLRINRVQKEDE